MGAHGSMYAVRKADICHLAGEFKTFATNGPRRNVWSCTFEVFDDTKTTDVPVVVLDLQVDKTPHNCLTIQNIEVNPRFLRQGVARRTTRALKEASVEVGKVAHFQSVMSDELLSLLLSEGFYPTYGGFCYIWKPLDLKTWALDTSQFRHDLGEEGVCIRAMNLDSAVSQLVDIWEKAIPGMDLFKERASWFKPETDLKKISAKISVPLSDLEKFRVDKACFAMSSAFAEKYPGIYVVEGLAIDPSLLPIAIEHACLCKVEKGEVYCFDLVRRTDPLMYGVIVRRDMKEKMNAICKETWAGYSVINGLNYVKNDDIF